MRKIEIKMEMGERFYSLAVVWTMIAIVVLIVTALN